MNLFKLTFREPLKHKETVIDGMTWAINLFKFTRLGKLMPRFFL